MLRFGYIIEVFNLYVNKYKNRKKVINNSVCCN